MRFSAMLLQVLRGFWMALAYLVERCYMQFTAKEDLETLWDELGCGKIHLAHEVCVCVCCTSPSLRIHHSQCLIAHF
jgi:hypothetical protein